MELISTHRCIDDDFVSNLFIFSKSRSTLDFIKPTVIRKLAYKDKYIDQIKEVLMFFRNSIIRIFRLGGLIMNNMEKINI